MFRRLAGRLKRDTAGHIAVMTAIMTPVALTLAAFAVDVGSLYVEKREAQALTDLAAITAANNLDDAQAAALVAMADNGFDRVVGRPVRPDGGAEFDRNSPLPQVAVVTGRYDPDPSLAPSSRFTPNGEPANAAQVTYRRLGARYFAGAIIPPPEIVTTAIASRHSEATFSVGSRLASLEGGLASQILGGLLGSEIALSVMDYESLLGTRVRLLDFLDALAMELDLSAGSYTDALQSDISVGALARIMSKMPGLDGGAKAALSKLAFQLGGAEHATVRLAHLLGAGEDGRALDARLRQVGAEVALMDILNAAAIAAGDGRQISLDLGATVPGLAGVTVDLAIGEPPQHGWIGTGGVGTLARTAQTRLRLVIEIGGLGGLLGTRVRLPLYLELAYAEARLQSISCPADRAEDLEVTVEARPGVANLYLAEVDPSKIVDFANPAPRSPAKLIRTPLVTVSAQAQAEIGQTEYQPLEFSADDVAEQRVKQVSTTELTNSLARSLFSSLRLDVDVIGLGLGLPSNLTGALGHALGVATPAIDRLLAGILDTLGLSLGQADVRVIEAKCGRSVLVQ